MASGFQFEIATYGRRSPILYEEHGVGLFVITPSYSARKYSKQLYYGNQKRSKFVKTVDGVPVQTLFVGNLPREVTNRDLLNLFGQFGNIVKVNIIHTTRNEPRKNFYGFVTFSTSEEAARALHGKQHLKILNRRVFVNPADSWHQPGSGYKKSRLKKISNSSDDCKSESEDEEKEEEEEEEEEDICEQDEESCPVFRLNDDCLHAVFSYIPINDRYVVGSVCRRWRYITNVMWSKVRKLDFSKPPLDREILTLSCLNHYVNLCRNLTCLNLSQDSHYLDSSAIATVAWNCKNLQEIRFSNIDLRKRSLALLARNCPNLQAFYMDGCSSCDDGEIIALITKCTKLRKIGVRFGMSLSGRWLKYLNCPLESLSLQLCEFSSEHLIEGITRVKDTIKTLGFTSCVSLKCSDLDVITETVPNLLSLTLSGSYREFKAHTLSPISRLTNLTELNLERNKVVCDEFIEDLLDHCPKLHYINLSATEDSLLSKYGLCLVGKFPELLELHLSYLNKLTDQELMTIANRATKLQHVYIVGCAYVSDDGSCSLVSNCHALEYLDVSGCRGITDKTVICAVEAVQNEPQRKKITLCIGGTDINLENDWTSPYVYIDKKTTYHQFMNESTERFFIPFEDQDENFDYFPDPLDEMYDFEALDLYDSFNELSDSDYYINTDSDESFEFF